MMIAFRYGDRRPLSRLIAWFQRSDASHCEAVLYNAGHQHVCVSSSMVDGGVRKKAIELAPEKWRIYQVDREADISGWLREHAGDGYDWLWLTGFLWRPIRGRGKRWGCSEACADMMGLPDPWRYDVADLENLCRMIGRRVQ